MIEIICKEEQAKEDQNRKEGTVSLPKNIRQEGSPRGRHKIYLEDYVYTFLKNMAKSQENCAAVFLGKSQVEKDIRYTFISGLVECSAAVFQWDTICLDDSFWDYIYKEEKQYFPELQIVGWFLGKAGQIMELPPAAEAAHRKYFSGRDKLLMLMDILEEEECFFVYEQGYLQKREGYYIYYEKNLAMQEYMICKREEEQKLLEEQKAAKVMEEMPQMQADSAEEEQQEGSEEEFILDLEDLDEKKETSRKTDHEARAMIEQMRKQEKKAERKMKEGLVRQKKHSQDKIFAKSNLEEPKSKAEEALEAYRKTILERQSKNREPQNRRFLYTASSFFLVVISVIGITTINNYRKMQKVEEVLRVMNPEDSVPEDRNSQEDQELVVRSVESQISPLDETQSLQQNDRQKKENTAASEGNSGSKTGKDKKRADETAEEQPQHTEAQDDKEGADAKAEEPQTETGGTENEKENDTSSDTASGEAEAEAKENETKENETKETAGQIGEPRYYVVQQGDTLSTICDNVYKNKNMIQTLKELNGIEDGDKIFIGQRLLLP
ncbi:MAG: LysM peptidoglycan-binding domain-containing protein [Lachnospiraceae bacterium]|nr:LysM peptidoglycan-binding domain-containing protein [Lachnospiraceae bacterium]